jgi:nucleotide-binding universal stress UspA family protein
MGVDRVQGDTLNFGGVAASVIEQSEVSVLLVSSGDSEPRRGASD